MVDEPNVDYGSMQCVRLSSEGDDIGAYFHFPHQISLPRSVADKREREGVKRGRVQKTSDSRSFSWSFLHFIAFVHLLASLLFLQFPFILPFLFGESRNFSRKTHNRNIILIWHMTFDSKDVINKERTSYRMKLNKILSKNFILIGLIF